MSRTARISTLVVAAVVLLVGFAGVSTAAKMITGKQIKNGTITSADVKNESLRGNDVKNGSLTGKDLKPGSIGPAQLSAAAKPLALFDEGSDFNIGTCADTSLDSCTAIVDIPLPAGTWLVTGSVTVDNFNGPATDLTNRCALVHDTNTLAEARTPLAANGAPGEAESIVLQDLLTTTGSTAVSLRCTEMVGESLRVGSPDLSALRVG